MAAGQTEWGVVWGSALNWTKNGLKCPLNVSAFAGLRFRAKGPGTVRVSLLTAPYWAKRYAGARRVGGG